jgi:NADH-quinone oxidoreductase subunit E
MAIFDAVRERLGLNDGRQTTADMLFTVETVSCLGACGLAPVLVINDKVHGQVKPQDAVALVDRILEQEGNNQ